MSNSERYVNSVLVERTVDNGDGTGTRTSFDDAGNVESVEQLTDLPIPEPEPVDPLAALLTALADAQTLEEVRLAAQEASL